MNEVIPFLALIGTVTTCVVVVMLARAVTHRLRNRAEDRIDVGELEDVRAHLASLQGQMNELLERQDFAERMLAQAREKGALGSGGRA